MADLSRNNLEEDIPTNAVYAGRLYATSGGNQTDDVKADRSLFFPKGMRRDKNFRQPPFSTSGGGAQSPLSAGDIPPGILVKASGSEAGGKRWAVLPPYTAGVPILSAALIGDDDVVLQYKFTLGLYADTGSALWQGGADVVVDVWYIPAV
jgi:hypothetical protein